MASRSECWLPLAEEVTDWEGAREAFWGEILFKNLDLGSASMGVSVCKNSSSCTLRSVHFTIDKLCLDF